MKANNENQLNKLKLAIKEHGDKKISSAEKIYREILEDDPESPDANHNLSILLIQQNRLNEVSSLIDRFINNDFAIPQYFHTASRYYEVVKDYNKSLEMINKAISISTEEIGLKFLYQKARILKQTGDIDSAIIFYERCLNIDPKNPIILNSYGVALSALGKFSKSISIFETVIKLKPELFDGHVNLGLAQQNADKLKEALISYKKAELINSKHQMLNINIGSVYQRLRKPKKALLYYNIAKDIDPNFAEIYNNIGIVYGEIGQKKKAFESYKKALKLNPNYTKAFRHISLTKLLDQNDPITIFMKKKYEDTNTLDLDRIEIAFGLGSIYEHNKNYTEAFDYFKRGNDLIKKDFYYDINQTKNKIKETPTYFPLKISISEKTDYSPIFILGMPRSGSTLLENIISNHTQVDSLGELTLMSEIVTKTKKNNKFWPEIINQFKEEDLVDFRQYYLKKVLEISPKVKEIFTDKMPYNFLYLGLIKSIFPKSKIIYTSRDSRDNCLSIYFLKLYGGHKYSNDLSDLAGYYNLHKEIMNQWFSIYQNEIYHFKYEAFVNNPKKEAIKLFEYCNLDYEEGLERFDLNKNMVRTASNHQVRDKLNASSIGRWKNYKNELKELLNELNKDTFVN
ncbi:tetratricopeptide repeat protein [Hyphomicrobiales bacterium]|nr:tetratricopeptide repeat protein [Hyphomicrobiales bacterium]